MARSSPPGERPLAWQRKVKRCARPFGSLRPYPAAMPADDALDRSQPDPGSLKFRRAVQALKRLEKLARIFHVEPRPVVPEKVDRVIRLRMDAELYSRGGLF